MACDKKEMDNGRRRPPKLEGEGGWTMDNGRWIMEDGQWIMEDGRFLDKRKCPEQPILKANKKIAPILP
ncbi:MAG: hypothetical protein R3275_11460 [Saprospiraceae bacterium]|nr:hypothetical protein [Saprospiraceae bacterium]